MKRGGERRRDEVRAGRELAAVVARCLADVWLRHRLKDKPDSGRTRACSKGRVF